MTEALVYKHFESKKELYEAAVMAPLDELLRRRIDDIGALPFDPRADAQLETTKEFMRTLLGTFTESVQTIGVVLFGEREHAKQFYARHIQALIDAAVAANESTIDTWAHREYDIRTAMKAAFGMAFWLGLDGVLDDPTADLEATADRLAEILFEGLKAR